MRPKGQYSIHVIASLYHDKQRNKAQREDLKVQVYAAHLHIEIFSCFHYSMGKNSKIAFDAGRFEEYLEILYLTGGFGLPINIGSSHSHGRKTLQKHGAAINLPELIFLMTFCN